MGLDEKCDIISGMKKNILFFTVALTALAACTPDTPTTDPVEYSGCDSVFVYQEPSAPVPDPNQSVIKYSVPNDNDLVLETAHHVIKIEGAPNKSYGYYVWAGGKDYSDDPDLIVEDGTPAVLSTEQ